MIKNKSKYFHIFFSFILVACSESPLGNINQKIEPVLTETSKETIGSFSDVTLSKQNLGYLDFNDKVINYNEIQNLSLSDQTDIFKKQLLRRYIVQAGINEGLYKDEKAFSYIWPRLEKILEDYYFYSKFTYDEIYRQKMATYYGPQAIKDYYEKNQVYFRKNKLSESDVDAILKKKIESMALAEWNQKKLEHVGQILEKNKFEIEVNREIK